MRDTSNGHRGADVDLDDPGFERTKYDPWIAYGRSKTANSLFATELDRRLRGRGIRASAVMPGTGRTSLMKHLSKEELDAVRPYAIDPERARMVWKWSEALVGERFDLGA